MWNIETVKMNVKYLFFIVFLTISLHVKNCRAEIEVKTSDDLLICTVKLDQCKVNGDFFTETPISEPRGVTYLNKLTGEPGSRGPLGVKGEKGDIGPKGSKGVAGKQGQNGNIGDRGDIGLDGKPGDQGNYGTTGKPGLKGERGSIGPHGGHGSDGECKKICPALRHPINSDRPIDKPLIKKGARELPLETLCTDEFKGKNDVWINPYNPFKVACDEEGKTCIHPKKDDLDDIEKNAFTYHDMNKPFWLSSYNLNNKRFKLVNFYKQMTLDQIEFLQNSSEVIQSLRYYSKNSHVVNNASTNLLLLTWNDVTVGPKPSEWHPTHYIVNSMGLSKDKLWNQTDLIITGSSKRLPITDFYIRDIRKEDQSFYVEHISLCFK